MTNPNDTLPENLKGLISNLSTRQAMPLGMVSGIPFLALKIDAENEAYFLENPVVCELKPTVFNIDHNDVTVAICFVQVRLNSRDEHIYTVIYDLNDEKQYNDCRALLNMRKYGLFIASDNVHDFLAFETPFEADFDPRDVVAVAKAKSTEYTPEQFSSVAHALYTQCENDVELWNRFHELAPLQKQWYARMRMDFK
jgi:hypothetical protein